MAEYGLCGFFLLQYIPQIHTVYRLIMHRHILHTHIVFAKMLLPIAEYAHLFVIDVKKVLYGILRDDVDQKFSVLHLC